MLRSLVAALLVSSLALAQSSSESLERDARAAFKSGRFREAASKFQDAAAASPEDAARRAKMELQAGWALFNDRNTKGAKEAITRALAADANLEIVASFFSPDFVKLVEDVKFTSRPTPAPAKADLAELKRMATEKLADGFAQDVVYDLTSVPPEKLDSEAWLLLASAYEKLDRPEQAAAARRAAVGDRSGLQRPATPGVADAGSLLTVGRSALESGDLAAAQAAANRVLEIQPSSSPGYQLLGDVYMARGDKALAEANWSQALRYDDRNEAVLGFLFDHYEKERKYPEAIAMGKRAAAVNPAAAAKLVELGRRLRAAGENAASREAFAAATEVSRDARLLSEYGELLLASGDVEAAIAPLSKAAVLEPASTTAHSNLAAALRRKGPVEEAEKEYRTALRLEPDNVQALIGLGAILLSAGKPVDALPLYMRAAKRDAKNVSAVLGLARSLRGAGDTAGAAKALQEANGLDDAALWNEAGVTAFEGGRYTEAVGLFERALAKDPGLSAAQRNREKALASSKFLQGLEDTPAAPPTATR